MPSVMLTAEWAAWMAGAGMSARTIEDRTALVERFETTAGLDSRAVSWQHVSAFLGNPHYQPGTRQTYYAHLQAWFHWLLLFEHRDDDPMLRLLPPKRPRRSPRPVTLDQLGRLLDTRMHRRTHVMILLGAYAGLRVSEIAAVHGRDLVDGELRVLGKGNVEAYIPVHNLIADVAARMPPRGWWFPSHANLGDHIVGKSVSTMIGNAMRRAGIPATAHALRHFYGTEMLRSSGGNFELVRDCMRHADVSSTALYTRVEPGERRRAVEGMPVPIHLAA